MSEDRLSLAELLAKARDGDFPRAVAEAVVQMLMEADVEGVIGAGRHARTGERTTYWLSRPAWTRAWDPCGCGRPSCGRAVIFRLSSRRGRSPRRRW
jgi:hypothetical protein